MLTSPDPVGGFRGGPLRGDARRRRRYATARAGVERQDREKAAKAAELAQAQAQAPHASAEKGN